MFQKSLKLGLVTMLVATSATVLVGHFDGQLMTKQQPMKMAAAEALWNTKKGAELSLFTIGPLTKKPDEKDTTTIGIPKLTSFLATNSFNGEVKGINQLQQEYTAKYGPASTTRSWGSRTGASA